MAREGGCSDAKHIGLECLRKGSGQGPDDSPRPLPLPLSLVPPIPLPARSLPRAAGPSLWGYPRCDRQRGEAFPAAFSGEPRQ